MAAAFAAAVPAYDNRRFSADWAKDNDRRAAAQRAEQQRVADFYARATREQEERENREARERCDKCKENRTHDVPGATEKFRSFFEKYTPDPGLRERRSKMYGLRSKILHGSDLMQLDQGRAIGWDPPWWNEQEMNTELWGLMRTAARNWLKDPT